MSLYSTVESKIQQKLDHIHQSNQNELTSVRRTLKQKVSDIQRTYDQEVEQAVKSQVNLSAFLYKKNVSFESGTEFQTSLDTLYRDLLPDLIQSQYGQSQLHTFFAQATPATSFEVTGTQSDLLLQILTDRFGKAKVAVTTRKALGSITYTVDSTVWEFSLEDFIKDVQSKTLPDVLALI